MGSPATLTTSSSSQAVRAAYRARRGAAGLRGRSSRRTRSPGAPPSSTTSSCRRRPSPPRVARPGRGLWIARRGADTLALELGELAQLKLAAISRHVSQTGSAGPFHDWRRRGARRVPGDRALPAGRSSTGRRPAAAQPRSRPEDGLPRRPGPQQSSIAGGLCYARGPHRPRIGRKLPARPWPIS